MTYEEAMSLKSFKDYCTCGGYAHSINGRNPRRPHMTWCPQAAEYEEYQTALEQGSVQEAPK